VNVSEPLSGSPGRPSVKVLKGGVEQPGFFGDPATETNTSFTYVKPVAAGLDGTYTVKIDLTDEAGNASPGLDGTGFEVDATAPGFTAHDVSPERVKAAQNVTVTFTTSEDLVDDPIVQLGPLAMTKTAQTGRDYTYKYTTTGAEGGGMRTVSVQLSDKAGNQGSEVFSETVEFDFTAPSVASTAASPNPAKLGSIIQYQATVTETLSNTPNLISTPALTWTGPTQNGLTYTWTHTVASGETNTYTAKLDQLCDQATNCALDVAAGMAGFSIDAGTPAVTVHSVSPSLVKSGQEVTVTFTASEPLAGNPIVQLGSLPMMKTGQTGQDYTYKYTTTGGEGDGTRNVTVQMTDIAGNVGGEAFTELVRFDFTSPTVTTSAASPNPAKLGAVITYSATVNETITNTPTLVSTPALTWTGPSQNGLTYTWTHTVAGGETNAYSAKLDQLCDQATNCASDVTAGMSGFAVDTTPPAVTAVSVTSSNPNNALAKDGDVVTAVFTVGDETIENPAVMLGGLPTTFDSVTGSGPFTYTYKRTALAADGDGAKFCTVTATDAAGNVTVKDVGSVTFDFAPPQVAVGSEMILFTPPPGANVSTVSKLSYSAKARVIFATTEPVSDTVDPVVKAWFGGVEVFSFSRFSRTANSFTYDFTMPASGPVSEGDYQVTAFLTDLAGNQSLPIVLTLLPPFSVDISAPAPFTAPQLAKIVFTRAPWGLAESNGQPSWMLTGEAGSVEPSSTVVAYSAASEGGRGELGRVAAHSDGSFGPMTLVATDRLELYAALIDQAGNEMDANPGVSGKQALQVKNSEWVATLAHKVAGSTAENPNDLWLQPLGLRSPGTVPLSNQGALAGAVGVAGDPENFQGTAPDFRRVKPVLLADDPPVPFGSAMVFDSARGKVVLFGGQSYFGNYKSDTWEWDGAGWTRVSSTGPSTRGYHAMAFDSVRKKVVLFGGFDGAVRKGDTWEWDGTTWTQVSSTGPSARQGPAMAYDSARGKVILFGGWGGGYKGDTWEWDGANWIQASSTGPSARESHAMAYDYARGKAILFGGTDGVVNKGDTWEWDGASWTQVSSTGPSARCLHAMAYDLARGKTVLFGGSVSGEETWEWDGASWTQVSSTGPSARYGHAMAYDLARGTVVLFGQSAEAGVDTWEWDGRWTLKVTMGPMARNWHAMTDDSARGRVTMFGGSYLIGASWVCLGDTWETDGTGWVQVSSTGPSARHYHAIAYDSVRKKVVLFGGDGCWGYKGDTWEWDGATWTQVSSAGPSARYGHAMVYDSARGKVVLFGGYGSGVYWSDTWEWDGTNWTFKTNTGPAGRESHAMAFDSARGKVVLFGGIDGSTAKGDTWEWDGANWTQVSSAGPSARYSHAMAHDLTRGKTVLFGGSVGGEETWEWDGANWTQTSSTGPSTRERHAMAYDHARGKTILFGGVGGSFKADTWERDGVAWVQPIVHEVPHRLLHSAATDTERNRIIVFGGENGVLKFNDLWEWDGFNWFKSAAAGAPSTRSGAAMGFLDDPPNSHTLIFGGRDPAKTCSAGVSEYCADAWKWDGTAWTSLGASGPSGRWQAGMAQDGLNGVLVLFGGRDSATIYGDAWQWDGSIWSNSGAGPTARYGHGMAWDGRNEKIVVFGGRDGTQTFGDTWVRTGGGWNLAATTGPSARYNPMMNYDATRGSVVLYGGTDPAKTCTGGVSEYCADVWEWDGGAWTQVSGLTAPAGRGAGIMAYDPVNGGVLIHGGKNNWLMGDVWQWTPGKAQVGLIFEVDETMRQVAKETLTGAVVRAFAGGTGYQRGDEAAPGTAVNGVSIQVWDINGGGGGLPAWVELGSNAAPSGSISEFSVSAGADVLDWWMGGRMYIGMTAKASRGAGPDLPLLTVDYWELRLKYTLP